MENNMVNKMNKDIKTINLKGKEYAPVKERVKAFHEDCKNGSIQTNWFTAFEGEANTLISFKATVTPDVTNEDRIFTGHALGKVQNEKAFEKLETIAVGRALANAGYLADGDVASADEMERYIEQGGDVDIQTLPELNETHDKWKYAVKNIALGTTNVGAIKKHYSLTEESLELLVKQSMEYKNGK